VCLRQPDTQADVSQVTSMVASFRNGYNLRQVFAQSAAYCLGN
jgi:hypothetical protein